MDSIKKEFEDKKNELAEDIQETKEAINKSVKKGVTKTKKFFKRILLVSFLGLLLFGTGYMVWANYTYSSGTRTGYAGLRSE